MKTTAWWWLLGGVAAFTVVVIVVFQAARERPMPVVTVRDERAAAEALLAEKLSGPGYFASTDADVPSDGGPWIDVLVARQQVARVVAERKLGAETARDIKRLIDELAEPRPYRVVGGDRVNLLRLNLSLDSLKSTMENSEGLR